MVDGEVAVFAQVRNLRFINRFGEYVVRPRRCYKFPGALQILDYYHAAGHLAEFTRLTVVNGDLERYFLPRPEAWHEAA